MKDDLDRVLEGLGRVEAPVGLEARVLLAMASPDRRRSFVWGWVAVVALILVGVLVGTLGRGKSEKAVGLRAQPLAIESQGMGHPATVAAQAKPVEFGGGPTYRVKQRRDEWGREVSPVREDAPVVAEGGFPAPVEPLNEQELLLLKLARRATPRTLAVFNVKLQEEHAAMAKAEFDEFFKPVVVVATQPDPDLQVANPSGTEEKKDEALAGKR